MIDKKHVDDILKYSQVLNCFFDKVLANKKPLEVSLNLEGIICDRFKNPFKEIVKKVDYMAGIVDLMKKKIGIKNGYFSKDFFKNCNDYLPFFETNDFYAKSFNFVFGVNICEDYFEGDDLGISSNTELSMAVLNNYKKFVKSLPKEFNHFPAGMNFEMPSNLDKAEKKMTIKHEIFHLIQGLFKQVYSFNFKELTAGLYADTSWYNLQSAIETDISNTFENNKGLCLCEDDEKNVLNEYKTRHLDYINFSKMICNKGLKKQNLAFIFHISPRYKLKNILLDIISRDNNKLDQYNVDIISKDNKAEQHYTDIY